MCQPAGLILCLPGLLLAGARERLPNGATGVMARFSGVPGSATTNDGKTRAVFFDDVAANPIVVGDEILFYYMACGFPHGPSIFRETKWEGVIGRARLRLDGFVSLASPADSGGTVITRPVRCAGRRMMVNCNCTRGWLRVELRDADGAVVPGFAANDCDVIRANATHRVVTWHGRDDVSALAGKPVRVMLKLGDGEVYSFGFAE